MKKTSDIERSFETSDINLAATLCALGAQFESIDRYSPHKCLFQFRKNIELEKVVDSYWRRELLVEPQTILHALKSVKARLYDQAV